MTHVVNHIVLRVLRLGLTSAVVLFLLLSSVSSSVLAQPAAPADPVVPAEAVLPAPAVLPAAVTCTNLLADPGFEAGAASNSWFQFSSTNGTPVCTSATCPDVAQGPRTGAGWITLGRAAQDDMAVAGQTVAIPVGTAALKFYLKIARADPGSDANDVFGVIIDATNQVFLANATEKGIYANYTEVTVPLNAFADGGTHRIAFASDTSGQRVDFNVDDVSLCSTGQVVYMPGLHRGAFTNVYVQNSTGGTLCFEFYGTAIGKQCFGGGTSLYGTIPSGTYTYYATTTACGGYDSETVTLYDGDWYSYNYYCSSGSSGRPGVELPSMLQTYQAH